MIAGLTVLVCADAEKSEYSLMKIDENEQDKIIHNCQKYNRTYIFGLISNQEQNHACLLPQAI